jgi:hypothetical protein
MEIPLYYSSDITKTWEKGGGEVPNKSAAQNDVA